MSRRNKAALNLISGLIINYNDSDGGYDEKPHDCNSDEEE